MVASCHVKDALSAMTMLFSCLEIKKKLKQAGNNWWLLKYKIGADKKVVELNKKLQKALEKAKTASVEKSNFLFNMSHDIRTPMNAVISMTSLIRHDAGNKDKVIEYADKIDISSQHLLGIINDIQDSLAAGMNAHVSKPVEMKVLEKTIRSIKSGGGGHRTAGH